MKYRYKSGLYSLLSRLTFGFYKSHSITKKECWLDGVYTNELLTEGERVWLSAFSEQECLDITITCLGVEYVTTKRKLILKKVVTDLLKSQHIVNIRLKTPE